jgi:predicted acylesterase/phospholipase RssA
LGNLGDLKLTTALELIQDRIRDVRSTPGHRSDKSTLALIGCSGAMAGAISAAFAARLEEHDLRRIFDIAVSSSAGSIVNTYFLANQAVVGSHMIPTYLSDRGFDNDGRSRKYIDWRRTYSREHIWDLSMCVEGLMFGKCRVDLESIKRCGIRHYCIASTDVQKEVLIEIDSNDIEAIKRAIESTCRIPLIIDKNIDANTQSEKLWDGSLITSSPVLQARSLGATHAFVMHNHTARHSRNKIAIRMMEKIIERRNPALARSFRKSQERSEGTQNQPVHDVTVLELRPDISIGSFETNPTLLWKAMIAAYYNAGSALHLPDVPLPALWLDQMALDRIEHK